MDNLFSVIEVAKVGLMLEKAKVEVSTMNIASIHNPSYQAKEINFEKMIAEIDSLNNSEDKSNSQFVIDVEAISDDKVDREINLDQEVSRLTDAELRYQTLAQVIQKKFGLMDLIIGGKNK